MNATLSIELYTQGSGELWKVIERMRVGGRGMEKASDLEQS